MTPSSLVWKGLRNSMTPEMIDDIEEFLEKKTLEELFEHFDLTPVEVVQALFDNGFLDEELLKELI